MEITDNRVTDTSNLVEEFFKGVYRQEFAPFAKIEVKILTHIISEPKKYPVLHQLLHLLPIPVS